MKQSTVAVVLGIALSAAAATTHSTDLGDVVERGELRVLAVETMPQFFTHRYGVRREDKALLAALDEYVTNFRKTSAWNRLVVKYLGEAAPDILKRARTQQ